MQWGKNQIMMSCAAKVGLDWATLDACGTGAEGQYLMERSSTMSNERHITCVASLFSLFLNFLLALRNKTRFVL